MKRFLIAVALLLFPITANAVTYQYTGQNYNQLSYSNDGPSDWYELRGPYDLSMSVTASFEFVDPLPANFHYTWDSDPNDPLVYSAFDGINFIQNNGYLALTTI